MTQEKTLTRQVEQGVATQVSEDGSSDLARQVEAHAQVAREAYSSCQKGADAEEELHARRNTSAQ